MSRLGLPLIVVSDNVPCFKAYGFAKFCKYNHIKHIIVSPHYPAANGLAERAVQIFKRGVKKLSGNIYCIFGLLKYTHYVCMTRGKIGFLGVK